MAFKNTPKLMLVLADGQVMELFSMENGLNLEALNEEVRNDIVLTAGLETRLREILSLELILEPPKLNPEIMRQWWESLMPYTKPKSCQTKRNRH